MASCCCKGGKEFEPTMCLGRCDLKKHRCVRKKPKRKPIPGHMGWLYNSKDCPKHQQRCGWRPGHIYAPVLRTIEEHKCFTGRCYSCNAPCTPRRCGYPECIQCPKVPCFKPPCACGACIMCQPCRACYRCSKLK